MKVGVVTTSYPREPGDPAGAFVAGFTDWIAGRGHEVDVVTLAPGLEGAPERLARGDAWGQALLASASLAGRTLRRAHAWRWDAVVSHWLVPCGVVGALAASTRRVPHLAIAHGGDVHLVARRGAAEPVAAALAGSRVVFAGDHLRRRMLDAIALPILRRALADASAVCPMGIDAASFAAARAGDRGAAGRALGVRRPDGDGGAPVVAFLGRLVPIKGVDVLVDAFARLLARHPSATLVVAGEGCERPALEARVAGLPLARAGAVRFTGELRGAARDALFCAADLFVVPSIDLPDGRTEGTPTVALEALAAGVPLVASDVGGLRATCGPAGTSPAPARFVAPGDPLALAAAMDEALAERGTPAAAARLTAARAVAAEHDWQRVGPRLWDFVPHGERRQVLP